MPYYFPNMNNIDWPIALNSVVIVAGIFAIVMGTIAILNKKTLRK